MPVELLDGTSLVGTAMRAAAADHLVGIDHGDVIVVPSVSASAHLARLAVGLSTTAAWCGERGELVHRVVETHTMPPAGITRDGPDRRVLAGWLAH